MTGPATPRQRRRAPPPSPVSDGRSGSTPDHAANGPRGSHIAHVPDRETYAHGLIEFLDKRWTRAEADLLYARRSVLLVSCVAIACSMVILSMAVAAAGFVALVLLAQDMVGVETGSPVAALLVAIGASLLALTIRRRSVSRRPRPPA